jgi:hypothetical protein
MVYACNPNTREAEAGRSWVQSQPELCSKACPKKNMKGGREGKRDGRKERKEKNYQMIYLKATP